MEDLSHWDAVEDFNAGEAAALIAGVDPHDPGAPQFKAVPALARIAEAYEFARRVVAGHPMNRDEFHLLRASHHFAHTLASVRIECYPSNQKESWPGDPDRNWELPKQFRGEYGRFESQRFSRTELHRWLFEVNIPSKYQFERIKKSELHAEGLSLPEGPSLVTVQVSNETKEQRQARRYQACVDAGLTMPQNAFGKLPAGIGELAKKEGKGISRQSFSEDVKKHIDRLSQKHSCR
jgi:hypothetical protein